jgi:hypothetical protein
MSTYGGGPSDFLWDRSNPTEVVSATPYQVVHGETLLVLGDADLQHDDGRPVTTLDPLVTDAFGRYAFRTVDNTINTVLLRIDDSVGTTDWGPIASREAIQGAGGTLTAAQAAANSAASASASAAAAQAAAEAAAEVAASAGGAISGLPWLDITAPQYSADRTGATVSTAAINNALRDAGTHALAFAPQVVVYVPPGRYRVDQVSNAGGTGVTGAIQGQSRVWLRGDGDASVLYTSDASWSVEAGIIGIGNGTTTRDVATFWVSDLMIRGSLNQTQPAGVHGILYNTKAANGSSLGANGEPDAVHRAWNITVWDTDQGVTVIGDDDQAMMLHHVRGRRFLRRGVQFGRADSSGGGPDCYLADLDFSSANRQTVTADPTTGTYACYEIYATNLSLHRCKAWYTKRRIAYAAGEYKAGAGFFLAATRMMVTNLEAQDNGGHGVYFKYGQIVASTVFADSNSYYDNVTSPATTNECSGVVVGSGVSALTITGLSTGSRGASHRDQKYGVVIDSSSRDLTIIGNAWNNESVDGVSVDPADGVSWTASRHATHNVLVTSAYGSTRSTITNGAFAGASSGGGLGAVVNTATQETAGIVTGTTLTGHPTLTVNTPGGNVRYRISGTIFYRADSTQHAKASLRPAIVTGTGTVDGWITCRHIDASGTEHGDATIPVRTPTVDTITLRGYSTDAVASTSYTEAKALSFEGQLYAGTSVTTASWTWAFAENGGSGTGIKVLAGSHMRIEALT